MRESRKRGSERSGRERRTGAPALAVLASVGAYYRFRPQPPGMHGRERTYDVPAEAISFLHDSTWYAGDDCHTERHIIPAVLSVIRRARRFVVMDVFLFNLHHASGRDLVPTTRQIADAFRGKEHPSYFITDPLNTSYGTAHSEPLAWLEEAGVDVCITDLRKLRDNNLLYSPVWRLFLQWFDNGGSGVLRNPLRRGETTTVRAVLEALNARGNHRKVIIADEEGSFVTLVTSSNFEDASSYFPNVGLRVRDRRVARHFLESERAIARMSGCDLPVEIPEEPGPGTGDAALTPLLGTQIKTSIVRDLQSAGPDDELFVLTQFLSDRDIIDGVVEAAHRGVQTTVVLDRNEVNFGNEKSGLPNQVVSAELSRRAGLNLRWANSGNYEFHTKFFLLRRGDRCIINTGSANLTRRSLSGTNPEANLRIEAPIGAVVCQNALNYARWTASEPRSLPFDGGDRSRALYLWYRFIEATGTATF